MSLITIIGRGHGGTRAISHTLMVSNVFMGEPLNRSGDLHDQLVKKSIKGLGNAGNTTNVDKNSNVTANLLEDVVLCF